MSQSEAILDTSDSSDETLAQVLEEITRSVEAGEPVDLADYEARYPQYREQIREIFPAVQALGEIGVSLVQSSVAGQEPTEADRGASGTLGDYRIGREIGCGGMGVVYEAEQVSLGRRVALKVLPFAAVLDPRRLQRFHNEAHAAASLKHPNIVRIYSVGCERGVHYYAMEHIEGRTLAQVIAELRGLSAAPAVGGPQPAVNQITADLLSGGREAAGRQPADEPAPTEPAASGPGDEAEGAHVGRSLRDRQRVSERLAHVADTVREPHAEASTKGSIRSREFFCSAAHLGIQAAEALEHAHQMGVVHRDIKPSNLMVDAQGHLWITDFGLAQIEATSPLVGEAQADGAQLTMTGDVLGTLRYMSPEQAQGQRHILDHRTDIYSLGVTLYELLVLEPPFTASDRHELIHQILDSEPRMPCHVNAAIPTDLETIVLKSIAREPTRRYATAQQMADDLRRFLADEPIQARRPSLADRAAKWSRRHRSVVLSLVTLLLVVSVLSVTGVLLLSRERTKVIEGESLLHRHLYAAETSLAWRAWNNGDVALSREILQRYRPAPGQKDLRSFAWHYLWHLCETSGTVLRGHTQDVYHVAFSPDGRTLASGGKDRTIVLWDLATRQKRATLEGHSDDVNWIAFSPDGRLLATADEGFRDRAHPEPKVVLWDAASGQLVKKLTGFEYPVALVLFTPDSKRLVVAEVYWPNGTSHTTLWDIAAGQCRATIRGQRALALSPDGQTLAMSQPDGTLRLCDVATCKPGEPVKGHSQEIVAGAFSPDGQVLVTSGRDAVVKLWSTTNLRAITVLRGHSNCVRSLAFSPDGKLLASASDDRHANLWDLETLSLVKVLAGQTDRVYSVCFSPDGKTVAAGSSDSSVRLWNVHEQVLRLDIPPASAKVRGGAFLPDGRTILTVHADLTSRLWNVETGESAGSLNLAAQGAVSQVAVAPGQGLLAVGTDRGTVHLRDLPSGDERLAIRARGKAITDLAFARDGRLLATLAADDEVTKVWDTRTGTMLGSARRSPYPAGLHRLAFSPDGQTVATQVMEDVELWELATSQVRKLRTGHTMPVWSMAYCPDGHLIATGSEDQKIEFLDPQTGEVLATLPGHHGRVTVLAFSPDGRTLVSGSDAGEVKLWDVFTARELFALPAPCSVWCAAFSPDGTRLAISGTGRQTEGELYVYRAPSEVPIPRLTGDK